MPDESPPPAQLPADVMAFPARWLPHFLTKIATLLGYTSAVVVQQIAQYRSGQHYAALRLDSLEGEVIYLSACANSRDELAYRVRDDLANAEAAARRLAEFREAAGRG